MQVVRANKPALGGSTAPTGGAAGRSARSHRSRGAHGGARRVGAILVSRCLASWETTFQNRLVGPRQLVYSCSEKTVVGIHAAGYVVVRGHAKLLIGLCSLCLETALRVARKIECFTTATTHFRASNFAQSRFQTEN